MRLMCWLELVDCSILSKYKAVSDVLRALAFDDSEVTVEGPEWNEDLNMLDRFSVLYWNVLPGLDRGFKALSEVLEPGEYLLFEEKTRYGVRSGSTLRLTRVSLAEITHVTCDTLLEVMDKPRWGRP